jgi:pimeloyl-ACP methyl ester carboxylesterase
MFMKASPDLSLNVEDEGVRLPGHSAVVLLHGLGTDASLWEPQRAALSKTHRVISIEFPGHGSSPEWSRVALTDLWHSVWRILDSLDEKQATLVGTSMGAVVALGAASLQQHRVDRLILCGASFSSDERLAKDLLARADEAEREGIQAIADRMVNRWFHANTKVAEEKRRDILERFRRMSPGAYAACARASASYDLLGAIAPLQDRTCLVAGELDRAVPINMRSVATHLPGVKLLVLEEVGHYPALERPEEVNRLIVGNV